MNQTRARAALEDDIRYVAPLGSGSDYTVFLQRLGVSHRICSFWGPYKVVQQVASSDQSFIFTPTDPPYHYHSIYDSQMWQETYADPGFYRHVRPSNVARFAGLNVSSFSGCTGEDFGPSHPPIVEFDYPTAQYH